MVYGLVGIAVVRDKGGIHKRDERKPLEVKTEFYTNFIWSSRQYKWFFGTLGMGIKFLFVGPASIADLPF